MNTIEPLIFGEFGLSFESWQKWHWQSYPMPLNKRYVSLGAGSRLPRTYIGDGLGLPKLLSSGDSLDHKDSKFPADRKA